MQGNSNGKASARDITMNQISHLGLQHLHFARKRDRDFSLLAVYRTDFDGDFKTLLGALPAPISRHRFHGRKNSQSGAAMSNLEFSAHLSAESTAAGKFTGSTGPTGTERNPSNRARTYDIIGFDRAVTARDRARSEFS